MEEETAREDSDELLIRVLLKRIRKGGGRQRRFGWMSKYEVLKLEKEEDAAREDLDEFLINV